MNLFGHAVIARGERAEPSFALGAMLPDLARMSGVRLWRAGHPMLAAGVALHHRTDRAFHAAPSFTRLLAEGNAALLALGVGHGRALAAVHVGVELLLDGALIEDQPSALHYLEALRAAPGLIDRLEFRGEPAHVSLRAVIDRLLARGAPRDYGDPDRVAERVFRALAPRPRLALQPVERALLIGWLHAVAPRIRAGSGELLGETRARLAAPEDARLHP